MKKVTLLYNPLSGSRTTRRLAEMKAAVAILRDAGLEVTAAPTHAASDAAPQVRQAVAAGCDTVFACGGDGTIHDALQGMVGTQAALGIIPMGTANALAHDLGFPLSPEGAARAALNAKLRRIAAGCVSYQDLAGNPAQRYFTVTLGAGVDAHLFNALNPAIKVRFGMLAYYAQATWLWLTHSLPKFSVEFSDGNGETRQSEVSELLAVRIRNFGGVLRELAPGASLDRDDFRLVLFETRSRLRYLIYIFRCLFGAQWKVAGIELAHSSSIVCRPLPQSPPIFLEADGEVLGTLPAQISIVPDALSILVPQR